MKTEEEITTMLNDAVLRRVEAWVNGFLEYAEVFGAQEAVAFLKRIKLEQESGGTPRLLLFELYSGKWARDKK